VIERGFVRPLETVSDLADSFRPIRELARVHLLSHLLSVSDGGIFRKAENNHLGHNSRGSTFGVPGDILGIDLRNPFRPITEETRTIVLSYTLSDSVGGISRAHSLSPGGVQTPRG
jgi:hypothetical protein